MWTVLALSCAPWIVVAKTTVAQIASRGLVRSDSVPAHVSAVVALSGSVTADGMLTSEALDRFLAAMALVRRGVASKLVATQPNPLRSAPKVTPEADQRRLFALLPDGDTLIITRRTTSTRTEAINVARILPPRTTQRIAVVTSPLHTRRACSVFEDVGFRVVCVPAESRDIAVHNVRRASDRLAMFRAALYERIAWLEYELRGWVA